MEGLTELDRNVCEDFSQTGTYPMPALPDSFSGTVRIPSPLRPPALVASTASADFATSAVSPTCAASPLPVRRAPHHQSSALAAQVHALVVLPAAGAWHVIFSVRRGESLLSAGFEWRTHGSSVGVAANATCPAIAEAIVNDGGAVAAPLCAAFLRHDPAADPATHEFGCVAPADGSACGASGADSSALSLAACCGAIAPYLGEDCAPLPTVILGPSGNDCPSGYSKLTKFAECRAGMEMLGLINKRGDDGLKGTEAESTWPSGCYYCHGVDGCTNGVWLNNHQNGNANGDAKPLCGMDYSPLA